MLFKNSRDLITGPNILNNITGPNIQYTHQLTLKLRSYDEAMTNFLIVCQTSFRVIKLGESSRTITKFGKIVDDQKNRIEQLIAYTVSQANKLKLASLAVRTIRVNLTEK